MQDKAVLAIGGLALIGVIAGVSALGKKTGLLKDCCGPLAGRKHRKRKRRARR